MFVIGDFARYGHVSVRMLRHYDALGLLRPAHVDPATGYRYYQAGQLTRLNRIIALKGLGFTLGQVGELLGESTSGEPVSGERLRGMFQLRHAELQARIAQETDRLRQVEARLRLIESEGHMPVADVVLKSVPAQRVAELTAVAQSWEQEDIGPVIGPLYRDLCEQMDRAGVTSTGPGIAWYEDVPDSGGKVVIHATVPVDRPLGVDNAGFTVVDLLPIARAATIVHHGPMSQMMPTEQALAAWVEQHGYRTLGYPREVNIECPPGDFDSWVTELQLPVGAA
jgi:DNA-binding transcriptional MerR regulator